jgi:hypothetical protein
VFHRSRVAVYAGFSVSADCCVVGFSCACCLSLHGSRSFVKLHPHAARTAAVWGEVRPAALTVSGLAAPYGRDSCQAPRVLHDQMVLQRMLHGCATGCAGSEQ